MDEEKTGDKGSRERLLALDRYVFSNAVLRSIIREKIKILRRWMAESGEVLEEIPDFLVRNKIRDEVTSLSGNYPVTVLVRIGDIIFDNIRRPFGILSPLLEDKTINEIMVNGTEQIFFEDQDGIHPAAIRFEDREELEDMIRRIAGSVHREITEMTPILDARLPDGSRVNAVFRNVAWGGPVLTIRKFAEERITIEKMIQKNTLTEECAETLKHLVRAGYNIFISGGTSSGKTTFLNALTDFIPERERVIVIEDSRELSLPNIHNLVQMECHTANSLGKGEITMDMLIKTSLRMRPDRIVVGEIRGKEVADMLQAMNTGHDGSMSTGHGNSVMAMLRRLEAMYRMAQDIPMDSIRAQITEGIDILLHLSRMRDGSRKVVEVQELISAEENRYQLNPLYLANRENQLVPTGNKLINRHKLMVRGEENERRL